MPIEKVLFSLIVVVMAVHSLASWWLLILVRNDIEIRTELFGSFKTLVLGRKAIRLKQIFRTTMPPEVKKRGAAVRRAYQLAQWTGWGGSVLLVCLLLNYLLHFLGYNFAS